MPAPTMMAESMKSFRPSQEFLDVFWTLSDGSDQQRNAGVMKLGSMIDALQEEEEKKQILHYCMERLIKGLSSGRKFARVGFSVALTMILRQFTDSNASAVMETIKDKLKMVRNERKSKAEVGGIYLGRAFAYSSLIQSGMVKQMSEASLVTIVEELTTIIEKKSYLKPVCNKTLEDLVLQVSVDSFGEHFWPKLREIMKQGWDGCTLDRLSLFLTCKDKFSDVVNKKFVKKHWGFPLLGEENDDKLLRVILDTVMQKKEFLLHRILPSMMKSERDVTSIWQGLGEKLMEQLPGKKVEMMVQRQQIGLQLAAQLVTQSKDSQQALDLVFSPGLAKRVFHTISKKNDPIATTADTVFKHLRAKLQSDKVDVKVIVEKLWKLDSDMSDGKTDLFNSSNFAALVDMMPKDDVKEYSENLVNIVKGQDKWNILGVKATKKTRQVEGALRQLHHLVCSQKFTTLELQKSVLSLFLRLAFFNVMKKNKSVSHCEVCTKFEEASTTRKLCETFFFKTLDQLSTLSTSHQKKSAHITEYTDLLFHLGQYFQDLMNAENINPIKEWEDDLGKQWEKLFALITKMKQKSKKATEARDSAFLLLFLFLGFHMLTDFKSASDLLQEVYVCYDKATKPKKSKATTPTKVKNQNTCEDGMPDSEPAWVEVVTEVLLSLLSQQSHLGRVVTSMVFRSLAQHVTPEAIQLITEVLIPKSGRDDDTGGVFVDAEDDNADEIEDEEDNNLLDEDVPEEESDDEENEDAEEMEDNDDEVVEKVDVQFREKVKQALGTAANDTDGDESNEEEEDLPDLSDSEMFKLDDMLAEVFRQRRKASGGGKKGREEKKKEMANFRVRVLDMVEVLVKGEHCGDFVLDLLKPLLLLILKLHRSENQALHDRSKSLVHLLRAKAKSLTDNVHSSEEQCSFFQELLDLAQTVSDMDQVQEVSLACHIVMNLSGPSQDSKISSRCLQQFEDLLTTVINKKLSKPHLLFFTSLIEMEPSRYQTLAPELIMLLRDTNIKPHGKMICCSTLSSLSKKGGHMKDEDIQRMSVWMKEASAVLSQMITSINKDDMKVMLTKDIFSLAVTLQTRNDILDDHPFGAEVKQNLTEIRPKLNTDLRRLANKIVATIERSQSQGGKKQKQKKKKRNSAEAQDEPERSAKKQKKN